MGPLKVISDGSLNTRTAWCCEPYADGGGTGKREPDSGHAARPAHPAREHGLEAAIHAIGDAAVHEALNAFEQTRATGSIEHAQLIQREDSRTMAQLGIRASVQPAHLLDDRDLTELFWPDQTDRCFALRWLYDDGVEVVLGSDAPVSPLDPWEAMAAAVHRSRDEREPWHAGADPDRARGAGRQHGRARHGRARAPGRPRPARRRPAAGRLVVRAGAGAAGDARRRDLGQRPPGSLTL